MSSAPELLSSPAPMRASILLVDDQPSNLLALEALLEPLGQRLVLARSGREALRCLLDENENFAVILLDMRMPGMDGFETASLIRQWERLRGTPLIFLTANAWSEDEIAMAYQLGAVDFLIKPLNAHIVQSKVAVFVDLFLRGERIKQHEAELRRRAVEHAAHVEQVLAAEALRRSEAKFRQIAESGMIGLLFADLGGGVTDANDAFLAMVGYDREDVLNRKVNWMELTPPEWRSADENALQELLTTGVARPFEKEYTRKDGSRLPIVIGAAMLEGSKSEVVAFILDNTRRKRAEEEQSRLIQSLARSNEELDQFAYIASHDLKAPLRGIANLSEWLEEDLEGTLTADAREKLNLIRGRVHRMEALINGILDYSRIGRVRHQTKRIEVGKLVADVIELLAPRPSAQVIVEPGMPVVRAEQVLMQQVFMNLIGNALKHARRDDPIVRVGVQDAGLFHEFVVSDNGQGIAPEYHEKIWSIFQTLEARDKVEGTGIGLSVVKKIVELRGGRAWVESAVGAGAAFHFTWPKGDQAERT